MDGHANIARTTMSDYPRPRLTRLIALCLAGTALTSHAFGPDGHRIVGELAQERLSPAALGEVRRLLGDATDGGLAGVANWADDVRDQPEWRRTGPWHYVNFPRGRCDYDAQRDCRDGRCIVAALTDQVAILGDRSRDDAERAQALRFVVHFVGDIHQPLHAGYGDDRGGNTFQVFYIGRGSNLHALWDGGILRSTRLDWREHADRLADRAADADTAWSAQAPRRWAEQSCRLIGTTNLYPPRPGKLPAGYVEQHYPVVEQQLVTAAARLAATLEAALMPASAANGERPSPAP